MRMDQLPTPCYVIDEKKLKENLEILGDVREKAGCKILLAQKAFSGLSGKAGKKLFESAFLFFDPVCLSDFYLLFLSEKASLYTSLSIHTHTDV